MKKILLLICVLAGFGTKAQYLGKFITDNTGGNAWNYFSDRIHPCTDGGLLFLRTTQNQITFQQEYVLVKTDSLFNHVWSSQIGNLSADARIQDIGEVPGGGYFVFFNDNANGTGSVESEILITFDNNGTLLWSKIYDVPFQGIYARSKIKFFPNGDFLMLISDYAYAGYIIISPNGTMIMGEEIKADSTMIKNPGFDAVIQNDSTFTLASKADNENYFATISRTSNTAFTKKLISPTSSYYHQPRSIIQLADGNLLVAGLFQDSIIACGFVMKIDQQFNIIWRKLYTSPLFSGYAFNDVIETPGGDLVVKDEYNVIMLHLDASGQINYGKIIDGNNTTVGFTATTVVTSTNKFNNNLGTFHPALFKNSSDLNNKCLYADYSGFISFTPVYNPTFTSPLYRNSFPNNTNDANITITSPYTYTLDEACAGVGINEHELSDFSIYPNPASDQMIIQLNNENEGGVVMFGLYDAQGRQLTSQNAVLTKDRTASVNVSAVPNGIYFLRVLNGTTAKRAVKLIISH